MTIDEFWDAIGGTDPTRMGKAWQVGHAADGLALAVATGSDAAIDEFCDRWIDHIKDHARNRMGTFLENQMHRSEVEAMRSRAHAMVPDVPLMDGGRARQIVRDELKRSIQNREDV